MATNKRDGSTFEVPVTYWLEEVSVDEASGMLQRFTQDFLAAQAEAG